MNTLQKTKTPVKITNYNTSAASSGKEDIIILSKTRISPITSNEIDFPYLSELTASGILPDLSALKKLAAEQLVTIKAEVAQVSAVKTLRTQYQGVLKKQEVTIRDPTTSVKLLLWENSIEMLELNKTYKLYSRISN